MFLITGYPRSATRYMAKIFQSLGFDVGHEEVRSDGIVSWMELLNADNYDVVLHQVRNPIDVIASATTLMNESLDILSTITTPKSNKIEFLMESWLDWTNAADDCAQFTYKIEDLKVSYPQIKKLIGLESSLELPIWWNTHTNVNTRPHIKLSYKDLKMVNSNLAKKIALKMKKYGYAPVAKRV